MTTNEQIETAAILQMNADLDEARELVTILIGEVVFHRGAAPDCLMRARDFMVRTDATASNT